MQGNKPGDLPFTPPAASVGPTVLIALVLGAAVWAGVHLAGWWPAGTVQTGASTGAVVEKTVQVPLADPARAVSPKHRQSASAKAETSDTPPPAWSRCEIGGRVVYSDTACQGNAVKSNSNTTGAALSVVSPVAVRSEGPTVQQFLPRAAAPTAVSKQNSANALEPKARECAGLEARIRKVDAQARQPQTGSMQDWLSGERRTARDRQFALRC